MDAQTNTAVVLDSTSYLPAETLREHEIPLVGLYVHLDGREERETDIADYSEFYSRLRASANGPTTSQPSVGDFLEVWKPILEAGREIVSIHLGAKISGTHESAVAAREQLIQEGGEGEKIHIVDSASGAAGAALCALAAIRVAEAGGDPQAVKDRFAEARSELGIRFAMDSLEYLRRGGRIGGAQAFLGSALTIKPILSFDTEVIAVARVRTKRRALDHLRGFAREQAELGERFWVVQHVDDPDAAAALADDCREIFGGDPAFITEMGPVLGSHSGPGLIGLAAISAEAMR